jgi:hypothetical protein
MLYRSLAAAALTLAGTGAALAQTVYLYVAPGASVYVTPPANGIYGAPPAAYVPGGAVYGAPGPVVATPLPGPVDVAPDLYAPPAAYVAPAPAYAPAPAPGYDAPLQAYGAATGSALVPRAYVRQRIYDQAPRPPAPVPYGWRRW